EDSAAELDELKKAIEAAGMPEDTHKHAVKEFKRLQRMGEGSAEGSMRRTSLVWRAELPWKLEGEKAIDIAQARRILDEDHFGLDKIKRRNYYPLAVRKIHQTANTPNMC